MLLPFPVYDYYRILGGIANLIFDVDHYQAVGIKSIRLGAPENIGIAVGIAQVSCSEQKV